MMNGQLDNLHCKSHIDISASKCATGGVPPLVQPRPTGGKPFCYGGWHDAHQPRTDRRLKVMSAHR